MALGSLNPRNPYHKQMVGSQIFEFVEDLLGVLRADDAGKVCDILINLPLDQITAYLRDYDVFKAKVKEAVA